MINGIVNGILEEMDKSQGLLPWSDFIEFMDKAAF